MRSRCGRTSNFLEMLSSETQVFSVPSRVAVCAVPTAPWPLGNTNPGPGRSIAAPARYPVASPRVQCVEPLRPVPPPPRARQTQRNYLSNR